MLRRAISKANEYFSVGANKKDRSVLIELKSGISATRSVLSPEQAKELGIMLIAAAARLEKEASESSRKPAAHLKLCSSTEKGLEP